VALARAEEALTISRSLPHGHVAAVLGTAEQIGLPKLLSERRGGHASRRARDLVMALVVSRLIAPASKLATVRALDPETAASSLGERLGLGEVAEREIYEALDWLLDQQERIENALAKRHLAGGTLALYDVSSSYFEGRCCALAKHGYSRDHRPDRLQIVYGLLCNREGCPVAIEVFEGNTADPMTLSSQVQKLKLRFGLDRVVVVGDRGMITSARIREDLEPAGLDWITALRASSIQELTNGGPLQLSLFDDRDLAEITSPDYPGERLIVCRNPLLAAERRRKRADLLAATERDLSRIALAIERRRAPRRGRDRPQGRRRARSAQDGKALRADDHRHRLRLAPQGRGHRRRSAARRHLCHPHQRGKRGPHGRADGRRLQILEPSGAGLPLPEDHRSGDPTDPSLVGAAGARPCLPVHAGLLRRIPHAKPIGANPLRRS